ncbi:MAG: response regulator, partial [Bdellovibrionales bacterium]|nr:response regulator [Bdellovibrionales bacterium]
KDYTLIVLDVCMPEMNGLDVVTHLKQNDDTKHIPVLMLTGEDKAEDIMAGYSVGADYYITKPFTRQQLLFGLEIVLNGWES